MSDVCFIRPITLPNFVTRLDDLQNSDFSFLYSLKDYLRYYVDTDSNRERPERKFFYSHYDPELGHMNPLRRHHALNSYWKWLRLSLENDLPITDDPRTLYLLLPLKIDIPAISVKANDIEFPVKVFVYLFPFGSCSVNMNVKINEPSYEFDEYIDLVDKLSRAGLKENRTFKFVSSDIAQKINKVIFNDSAIPKSLSPHTMIFIKKTDGLLKFDEIENPEHIYAIAALITGKPVGEVMTLKLKE